MEEYKRISSEDIEKLLAKEFPGFRCGQAKPAPIWLYGESANLSNPNLTTEEIAWMNEHERLHKVFAARMKQRSDIVSGKSAISKKAAEEMGIPYQEVPMITEEDDVPHQDHVGFELKIRSIVRRIKSLRDRNMDYAVVLGYAGDCQVIVQYEDGNQCREMSYNFEYLKESAPEDLRIMSQQMAIEDIAWIDRKESALRVKILFAKKITVHYREDSSVMYQKVLKAITEINPRVPIESVNEDLIGKLPKFKVGDIVRVDGARSWYRVRGVPKSGYLLETMLTQSPLEGFVSADRLTLAKG